MAVVTRTRKHGPSPIFYAVNELNGKQVAEKVGPNRREAEIRDRAMRKEIERGTYVPKTERTIVSLRHEIDIWGKSVSGRSAEIYRSRLRLRVLSRPWIADMRVDEVRPKHIDQLVAEMRAERGPDGKRALKDNTISNALYALGKVFDSSIRAERATRNPVNHDVYDFDLKAVKRQPYSLADAIVLTRHHSIKWPTRVLNAMVLLTGMREGEACGRRWRDYSKAPLLDCLDIATQYYDRPLKTGNPRKAPVHPELKTILEHWGSEGFELYTGRKPTPDDFIVPYIGRGRRETFHSKETYYKAFIAGCRAAGVEPHTLHATRNTFISMCRRAGCNKEHLTLITHNPTGDVIDQYTEIDWEPLCRVVLCLNLEDLVMRPEMLSASGSRGNLLDAATEELATSRDDSAELPFQSRCPASGANLTLQPKTSSSENTRQGFIQESERTLAELSECNRRRKRKLQSLSEADPVAAKPGLLVCRALDATYAGETDRTTDLLAAAAEAIGAGK